MQLLKTSATKLLPFIPAVILVIVAVHQIYLAKTVKLSPWKGGGFGMFSSTEYGSSRYVRVFVTAPGRDEELAIPESLLDATQRAAVLPNDELLTRLAEGFALRESRKERAVSQIRIEVWRTEFSTTNLNPQSRKIRDYIYAVH